MVALAVVVIHVAIFGAAREADEGTAARIFQLLMIAQVPIIAFFAIKWLPGTPREAVRILALQFAAAFAAIAPVSYSTFEQVARQAQTRDTLTESGR